MYTALALIPFITLSGFTQPDVGTFLNSGLWSKNEDQLPRCLRQQCFIGLLISSVLHLITSSFTARVN